MLAPKALASSGDRVWERGIKIKLSIPYSFIFKR